MIKSSLLLLAAGLYFLPQFAHAMNGLTYEEGGGVGYVRQSDDLQFKFLGNHTSDSHTDLQTATDLKLSLVKDIGNVDASKIYAGLGVWSDYLGGDNQNSSTRYDLIIGVRQIVSPHIQLEVFANVLSYLSYHEVSANNNGSITMGETNTRTAIFRTGAFAVSYFFD